MNITDILTTINKFKGRRFLIILVMWYLVYLGKLTQVFAFYATIAYFVIDSIDKLIVHKTEEESNGYISKNQNIIPVK